MLYLASQAERRRFMAGCSALGHRSRARLALRTMLEVEAFLKVHGAGKRLGILWNICCPHWALPWAVLATGLRLCELMGVIQNDGLALRQSSHQRSACLLPARRMWCVGTPV